MIRERIVANVVVAKTWVQANERWLSPAALIAGFVVDTLTIRHFDFFGQTVLLATYLSVIAFCIAMQHALEERMVTEKSLVRLKPFFPLVALFTFGSLFSAFLIFYARDAALVTSWPFIAFIVVAFLGTEVLKKYQGRITYQLALLYFGVFSFSMYLVPALVKSINTATFYVSVACSLILFILFVRLLWWIGKERIRKSGKRIIIAVGGTVFGILILYATNLIPPIPLALRDIGIYHKVTRAGSGYDLATEGKETKRFFFQRPTIHLVGGESAYAFSSIFAPTDLKTNVVHVWEWYDPTSNNWVEESKITFSISGGREEGYRGYTIKGAPREGEWRVSVETEEGLIIGRTTFIVKRVSVVEPRVVIRK